MKNAILNGEVILGIELGSTRIKSVLTDKTCTEIIETGIFDWENAFENGYFTYGIDDVLNGISSCYGDLSAKIYKKYGIYIEKIASIGISAMMHGYIALDKTCNLLVPFRTWRNTTTGEASKSLTELFSYNIPQRWSISHLYQAILNDETHIPDIDFVTTLAGYVHLKLTGEKVIGVGDASGMFPIDINTHDYNTEMAKKFENLTKINIFDIFPKVLVAGENAGILTEEGAKLLDKTGKLKAGVPLCPPEGDAGTGMVATNSVKVKTGNVSAGTSIFAMIVMERELTKVYEEIDLVTTPSGDLVSMVHCNNCTSDINAWVSIFTDFLDAMNVSYDINDVYTTLFNEVLKADESYSGLMSYNYFSGEPITELTSGVPLFVREINSKFNLANFMKTHLYSSVATLAIGMDILKEENVQVSKLIGHGGFFKTPIVGQQVMADALNTSVSVMDTASEGGAYGIAVLASYLVNKGENEELSEYLSNKIFKNANEITINPKNTAGFNEFIEKYKQYIKIEKCASEIL